MNTEEAIERLSLLRIFDAPDLNCAVGKDGFPCVKCKHIEFYGTQEIDGWEWRGPQKGENND